MDNTIDRKDYDEKEFKKILVQFLKNKPQGATQLEMVVGTGLSKDWVDLAVRALLDDYPAHLETNDKHELIYVFDFEVKEENLTFSQVANKVLRGIWKGFIVFFKVWTLLMYCTYFVVNALILLAFVIVINIAAFVSIFTGEFEGFFIPPGFVGRAVENGLEVVDDAFASLNRRPSEEQEDDKGAVHQMFSYIFGETLPKADDLAIEKLLLSFIAQNGGKIVASEIVQLTGWSIRKAQEEAAQLMANYHGDAEVTDEGVIVYIFADLEDSQEVNKLVETYKQKLQAKKLIEIKKREHKKLLEDHQKLLTKKTKNESGENTKEEIAPLQLPTKAQLMETHAEEIEEAVNFGTAPIWVRLIPARKMNDNDDEMNRSIASGNKFNWIMSFLSPIMLFIVIGAVVGTFNENAQLTFAGMTYLIVLFIIPFCYSFLFWLIPRLRRFGVNRANRRIDAINEKYRLLGLIFEQASEKFYRNEVVVGLKQQIVPEGKKLRNKDVGQLFDQTARALEADSLADERGAYYTFEQVQTDLTVINHIRNG